MATGPSTAQTPYLVPTRSGVSFTSIISAGDGLPGSTWKLVGLPDGMGAFDNGDGTITVLLNHELSGGAGIVRAHGSAGAFVDRLVIDINSNGPLRRRTGQQRRQHIHHGSGDRHGLFRRHHCIQSHLLGRPRRSFGIFRFRQRTRHGQPHLPDR